MNKQGTTLIIKDRGTGKSTQLIYTSASTQYRIVTPTKQSIRYLMYLANCLGLEIPTPMTIEDYRNKRKLPNECILIDEGYDLIGEAVSSYIGANVVAITLSDKIKETNN